MNIEKALGFLVEKYAFSYKFQSFSKDVSGSFYGPMNTYSFFNKNGCFTVYHAVQRNEWEYYASIRFSENQAELVDRQLSSMVFTALRNKRKRLVNLFKSDSMLLAETITEQIKQQGEFFGIKV